MCSRSNSHYHKWKISFTFYSWKIFCYTHTHTHIFFINSSISGHLVCFCVLATLNNAAMNMRVHTSVFLFHSDKCPEVVFLDHMVVLFLIFWRLSILFTVVAAPTYISTSIAKGFPFCHIFANTFYFLSFRWQPFWQVWDNVSLWFDLHFPESWWCWTPFHVGYLYVFF